MIAIRSTGADDWDEYDEEMWDQTEEYEMEEARERDKQMESTRADSSDNEHIDTSGGDPRLSGMDSETYQYWAQQGYSHEQIVEWWKQANSSN